MPQLTARSPQLRILDDEKIAWILKATYAVLERTGVDVHNAEARQLLAGAGASVDGLRVRIPAHILDAALRSTPREFSLWGRNGENALVLAPDHYYFGPGPSSTFFIDPQTGERRKTRRGDPGQTARVCDALENIHYVMSLGLIDGVTPRLAPVYEFAEMVANTTKPIVAWSHDLEEAIDIYQIAVEIAGSEQALRQRPFMAFFSCSFPPLSHSNNDLANQLWMVEHHVPVVYMGGGALGMSAPITGIGAVVSALAETLSGLAILQLKKPGAPVCIGSVLAAADMRTARPSYGGPEMSLYCGAMSEIARYLKLPYMGTSGASESKTIDAQAGIESTMQTLFSALTCATLAHDVGFLDCADIGSLEMLVMNDEIISMTQFLLRGVETGSMDDLLDLIDSVGPGGEYITSEHTLGLCRTEIWMPRLMNRDPWDAWSAAGSPGFRSRVQQRLRQILQSHVVPPLSGATGERIEAILREAEARCGGQSG